MKGITYYELELNKKLKLLVFNSPTDQTVDQFNQIIDKHEMKLIFRLCEPIYDKTKIINSDVVDILIDDGEFPSSINISNIINQINTHINTHIDPHTNPNTNPHMQLCVGLHCKAGLGRSPTMAAILMMFYNDVKNKEIYTVIKLIREKIPRAINQKQLHGLLNLDVNKLKKEFKTDKKSKLGCIIT